MARSGTAETPVPVREMPDLPDPLPERNASVAQAKGQRAIRLQLTGAVLSDMPDGTHPHGFSPPPREGCALRDLPSGFIHEASQARQRRPQQPQA